MYEWRRGWKVVQLVQRRSSLGASTVLKLSNRSFTCKLARSLLSHIKLMLGTAWRVIRNGKKRDGKCLFHGWLLLKSKEVFQVFMTWQRRSITIRIIWRVSCLQRLSSKSFILFRKENKADRQVPLFVAEWSRLAIAWRLCLEYWYVSSGRANLIYRGTSVYRKPIDQTWIPETPYPFVLPRSRN